MADTKTIREGVEIAYELKEETVPAIDERLSDVEDDCLSKSEGGTVNANVTIQGGSLSVSGQFGTTTYGSTNITFSPRGGSYVFDFPYKDGLIGMWGDDPFSVSLEMDEDYKLKVSIRKNSGSVIESQIVDLPLESMVVDVEYDEETKCLVITLQNGETTSIPVGDLIGGNVVFLDNVTWVRDNQTTVSIAVDPTHNINGKPLTNFSSSEQTVGGYPAIVIQTADSDKLTKEQAARYMKAQTGSSYVPEYDYDNPSNPYIMFSDKTLWKPQWRDDLGLVLFSMGTTIVDAESDQTITGAKNFFQKIYLNGTTNYIYSNSGTVIGSGGTDVVRVTSTNLNPTTNGNKDLGNSSTQWRNLYLSGNLTDGTNSTTVANIATQTDIQNVREVAEGKCKSYVLSLTDTIEDIERLISDFDITQGFVCLEDGTDITSSISDYEGETIYNSAFNTQNSPVNIGPGEPGYLILESGTNFQTATGFAYILVKIGSGADSFNPKTGDIFLIVETDVPDRWFSFTSGGVYSFYKMETAKVDLTNYVTTNTAQTITGAKTINNELTVSNGTAWLKITGNGWTSTIQQQSGVGLTFGGASLTPNADGTKDFGSSAMRWKDLYLSGKIDLGASNTTTITTNASSELVVDRNGTTIFNFGNTNGQAQCYYTFAPVSTGVPDLGTSSKKWRDLYLSGTANIGSITLKNSNNNLSGIVSFNNNISYYIAPSRISSLHVSPIADNTYDLGINGARYKDLYLAGNLSDGTNSVAVSNIAKKDQFVKLTQAQYDALTPDEDTFYFIEEE